MHVFDVESGQSEKIRVLLCSSRTYGRPTIISDTTAEGDSCCLRLVGSCRRGSKGRWSTSAKELSDFLPSIPESPLKVQ